MQSLCSFLVLSFNVNRNFILKVLNESQTNKGEVLDGHSDTKVVNNGFLCSKTGNLKIASLFPMFEASVSV